MCCQLCVVSCVLSVVCYQLTAHCPLPHAPFPIPNSLINFRYPPAQLHVDPEIPKSHSHDRN
ncbi:MAG: hypothetical protein EAZ90_02730 [Oscillatoriales cyanobacterium]|nr:MAG: hypothetical protein EAZ94_21565 [Oscillatoriales cyanobacterium]TAE28386.1 MAG: hypothetical protein EAZ93_03005 [Oscillatoriales cyanobacterium]TAE45136.1 MAG: hypothetical protein EAZ90_02730 [Oscillatoriales cyanobacterium]TAE64159.1 MAG: hypothetical protein EAZ86_27455 [Oscillatoriales cyanobacterium]TAF85169.1 MAG: hypothetical protein EAZ49_27425 [Oscillatoriales cyanobacterium]